MTDPAASFAAPEPAAPVKGRSLWDDAQRRLRRNPAAMVSLWVLAVLVALAVLGGLIAAFDEQVFGRSIRTIHQNHVDHPPTFAHGLILGTDAEGRDLLSRLLFGLGMSLAVGVTATAVSLLIGVLWGAVAGFVGGVVDQIMMRIVDVIYAIPFIFFVILLMVTVGQALKDPWLKLILIFAAIGAVEWLTMARIVRGQAISLKRREFVEAARAGGETQAQIILGHIVPNALGPVVVFATLNVPVIILAESFLSFLGLGVQEPLTSLGQLIARGADQMWSSPWQLIAPATVMFITLLCLNFLGDGLRDALDPKDR